MLTRIAMLLSGLNMARFTQAWASLTARLCKLANNLRVSIILASLSVVSLCSQLVKILLSFKASLVSLTTQAQSIKLALKHAATTSGLVGQQLVTTARQTLQHVKALFKRGK